MEFDLNQSANILEGQNFDLIVELVLLLVVFFYSGFNLLVYKQVRILNQSIQTTRAPFLKRLAKIQMIATAVLLVVIILLIIF